MRVFDELMSEIRVEPPKNIFDKHCFVASSQDSLINCCAHIIHELEVVSLRERLDAEDGSKKEELYFRIHDNTYRSWECRLIGLQLSRKKLTKLFQKLLTMRLCLVAEGRLQNK